MKNEYLMSILYVKVRIRKFTYRMLKIGSALAIPKYRNVNIIQMYVLFAFNS